MHTWRIDTSGSESKNGTTFYHVDRAHVYRVQFREGTWRHDVMLRPTFARILSHARLDTGVQVRRVS